MNRSMALSEDQRDCLQEICNVAMGQAGDSLARLLGAFVHLSIPAIEVVSAQRLAAAVAGEGERGHVIGAQRFGEALVLYAEPGIDELQRVLADSGERIDPSRLTLADVTGVLAGTCVEALVTQLCEQVQLGTPRMLGAAEQKQLLAQPRAGHDSLMVSIHYELESGRFTCDLVLLLDEAAGERLLASLDSMLADL